MLWAIRNSRMNICKHFSIETSEYFPGYIAEGSSGKGMKELKSSLDTIRRKTSELIMDGEKQAVFFTRGNVRVRAEVLIKSEKNRVPLSTQKGAGIKFRVQWCFYISSVEKCLISCSSALLTSRHTSTALWTSLILSTRLTAF